MQITIPATSMFLLIGLFILVRRIRSMYKLTKGEECEYSSSSIFNTMIFIFVNKYTYSKPLTSCHSSFNYSVTNNYIMSTKTDKRYGSIFKPSFKKGI